MLKKFEGSSFRRTAAAQAAGLTCGLALPIFVNDELTAVLVAFCGDPQEHHGALELWKNDPRVTSDLTLADGYYGTDGAALEALTRDAFLPKGSGLPGLAWQRGSSVFIDDIGASAHFLRTSSAVAQGIDRGLAIPWSTRAGEACVAVFLSASATPVARRIERWLPDATGLTLQRADGICERTGPLTAPAPVVERGGHGTGGSIATAFSTGTPVMVKSIVGEPENIAGVAVAAGLTSLAAIPVVVDGAVAEVVALYF